MLEKNKIRLMAVPVAVLLVIAMFLMVYQQNPTGENRINKGEEINHLEANTDSAKSEKSGSTEYTVHEPIRIKGNEDFAEKAEENGWSGDGSEDDPYVIEGYEIKGGGDGYGIYIGNVTDFFVIRNLYVHNITGSQTNASRRPSYLGDGWIILYNSQNGQIEQNKFRGGSFGDRRILNSTRNIRLISSKGNMIVNNSIMNGSIRLSGGSYNIINHNLIQN